MPNLLKNITYIYPRRFFDFLQDCDDKNFNTSKCSFATQFGPLFQNSLTPQQSKLSPKDTRKASETPFKNLKKHWVFDTFSVHWYTRKPQKTQKGSQEAPKNCKKKITENSKNMRPW